MRKRLLTAPRWVQVLLYGAPFGVVMAVYSAMMMINLTFAGRVYVGVVMGLLGGAGFGFVMARFTSRQLSSRLAAIEGVPDALRPVAMRSAWSGPAPVDQTIRRAALRVVENTRDVNDRRRRSTAAIFTFLSLLYLALALTSSPWWWPAFAFFVGLFALHLTARRRINRRIAILSEDSFPPGDGSSAVQ